MVGVGQFGAERSIRAHYANGKLAPANAGESAEPVEQAGLNTQDLFRIKQSPYYLDDVVKGHSTGMVVAVGFAAVLLGVTIGSSLFGYSAERLTPATGLNPNIRMDYNCDNLPDMSLNVRSVFGSREVPFVRTSFGYVRATDYSSPCTITISK